MCTSEGVQGGGRSKPGLILLDFWQTGPVDPDFFGQEPSLDCKDSFEPKSSFLDQMVQKLRAYKGLYVFPFPGLIYRYLDNTFPKNFNNMLDVQMFNLQCSYFNLNWDGHNISACLHGNTCLFSFLGKSRRTELSCSHAHFLGIS